MDLIFWVCLSNIKLAESKLKLLNKILHNFRLFVCNPFYAPPDPKYVLKDIKAKNIIIVGNMLGDCNIYCEGTTFKILESYVDYKLHLNIPGSTIQHPEHFMHDLEQVVYSFNLDFNPIEYFEYKKEYFPNYKYELDYLKVKEREIIYVIGMPYIGKTHFAKNIALRWNYKYVKKNEDIANDEWSYIVDSGKIDYTHNCASRIFYLGEHELNTKSQILLGEHLALAHKKKYGIVPYNCKEIRNFHESLSFSGNIKIEYITVINYQIFTYGEELYMFYCNYK